MEGDMKKMLWILTNLETLSERKKNAKRKKA